MRAFVGLLLACAVSASPAVAQNTQRGAAVGGVTGAIAGALIGDHNGEAGAGAAIGGLVGAGVGAVFGNAKDKEQEQARYYAQQQRAVAVQAAVSTADVVAMCRSGLSDSLVVNQVSQRGVQRRLEVADIIQLHQAGVSEPVISAMQHAPVGGPPVYQSAPQPVIVERHYAPAPVYYVAPPRPRVQVIYGAHYGRGHHHHW
ncbi:hypothetical protein Pla175_15620 [Pirellulimonas nuda]|uniref:Glycine zipper domain-containing protein n=1 Tax=Pirellulimonas nuda TaxID=2528009 RepID=A0A518D9M9_9BACT|nr:glycine zipper domain-containing protein [Pirellulimonas nuda]QDU88190.1 hypothetical protein Pla175_15620 [Pirellulimonas nuda]